MKKISQINWKRYKESEEGKEIISLFEKAHSSDFTHEDMVNLAKRFNPEYFKNLGKKEVEYIYDTLNYYDSILSDVVTDELRGELKSTEDYTSFYINLLTLAAQPNPESNFIPFEELPEKCFKMILPDNLLMSILLYAYMPEVFMPNLFVMQFLYLQELADKYEIELNEVPLRSDYFNRCMYYIQLCFDFVIFANDNQLSPAELCAFLYGYELPAIKEYVDNEKKHEMPEFPGQAWILVGNYGDGEKDMTRGFWQANEETSKGDILLFYEKSPVKKLNSIWIAQENGIVDPFFYYYSNTYIGDKITIPEDKAITFEDFKNSEYFKNRDKKGNFVSKNFQDVSGWEVSSLDYKEILHMLEEKGFDTCSLPKLYEPKSIGEVEINVEKDVSEKLLIPLLEQMGWKNGIDFRAEIEFNAGRGKTGYSSDKRPDFCLHIMNKNDDIEAKVAIEVKKFMKNEREVHDNFVQGRSYAKWGNVKVLVLCDMKQIRVYLRDKNNSFNERKFEKFSWADMENTDKYSLLKRLLS